MNSQTDLGISRLSEGCHIKEILIPLMIQLIEIVALVEKVLVEHSLLTPCDV
jgi:hypothetical protein